MMTTLKTLQARRQSHDETKGNAHKIHRPGSLQGLKRGTGLGTHPQRKFKRNRQTFAYIKEQG